MASERDVKLVQAGIEAAAKAVSNRIEREEYGHAKAAVCLDLEAINALDPAAIVAEMGSDVVSDSLFGAALQASRNLSTIMKLHEHPLSCLCYGCNLTRAVVTEALKRSYENTKEIRDLERKAEIPSQGLMEMRLDSALPVPDQPAMGNAQHDFEQVGKVVKELEARAMVMVSRLDRLKADLQGIVDLAAGVRVLLPGEPKVEVKP